MSEDSKPKESKKPKYYKAATGEFSTEGIGYVESLAALGCTVEEIATVFKLSKATMERRMIAQPEIYEALQRGRVNAKVKVRKTAYDMATSGRNPFMTQFWLRCKDGWRYTGENQMPDINPASVQADIVAEIMGMSNEAVASEIEALTLQLGEGGVYQVPQK